eukprot:scaffold13123_cov112-Isochrysis_galbana.AAC.3
MANSSALGGRMGRNSGDIVVVSGLRRTGGLQGVATGSTCSLPSIAARMSFRVMMPTTADVESSTMS